MAGYAGQSISKAYAKQAYAKQAYAKQECAYEANIKRVGAEVACSAHNRKVPGSKPGLAIYNLKVI